MENETALNKAAEEVVDEEVVDEPVVEEAVTEEVEKEVVEGDEEVVEEEVDDGLDNEGLPTDHKERSNLGRKVSALLDKSDKTDEILQRTWDVIERIAPQKETIPDYTLDEPITKGELAEIEAKKVEKKALYQNDFKKSFHELSKEAGLSKEEKKDVGVILLKDYSIIESKNGTLDGARAFQRALKDYTSKKTPLQHNKVGKVITKQKTTTKQKPLEKLDAQSQSYYNYMVKIRGKEEADKVRGKAL